jgi:hypothetical protein
MMTASSTHVRLPPLATLVAAWDFAAPLPGALTSTGMVRATLRNLHGDLHQEEADGQRALRLRQGQMLILPRAALGPLDLHGRVRLSVHCRFRPDSDRPWQFLAGVWDERRHKRQYGLFYNGTKAPHAGSDIRTPVRLRAHAYASANGGHTPGHEACRSYATGATELVAGQWHEAAASLDGAWLRLYADGRFDAHGDANPMPFTGTVFDGGADGSDFTIGHRNYHSWNGYPETPPNGDEGFSGHLAAVAVYAESWERRA